MHKCMCISPKRNASANTPGARDRALSNTSYSLCRSA